jgi:hypothetical protein
VTDLIQRIDTASQLIAAAQSLHQVVSETDLTPEEQFTVFESWATALDARELDVIPGVVFLRLWLRRGTLEPMVIRELGRGALRGDWTGDGRALLKPFPLGVVGHWPAGNIEIQPMLSMTCGLLGGNAALVRIPGDLVEVTRLLMERLASCDTDRRLVRRIFLATFEHTRQDLQAAMAQSVDGAMIWGGKEAVLNVRALPFPHWARLAVFGPRKSVAAMDAQTWSDRRNRQVWCQRLARDVWQFDQQACSSPQVLFLEKKTGAPAVEFLSVLQAAFVAENRLHPRQAIPAALTSAICQARASWLLEDSTHEAVFPSGPDWTLLLGSGSKMPEPTQGRTLTLLEVDDLREPVSQFDGNVQTLGLAIADSSKEAALALLAGNRGVDRVVKLGRMHVFASPWDGADLIRPMVRLVRHVASTG